MFVEDRAYQNECVDSIFQYFVTHPVGNPVCALPTGTGKSVIIAKFLHRVFTYYPNQKVMVLTHVKELIAQNYKKLMQYWPGAPAGINSSGLRQRDVHDRIIFAGIGSVAKYAPSFGHVDLIVVDEADLVSPTDTTMYQIFLSALRAINPHLKVIGFTATPWRLGQGRITQGDGLFTDLCFDITGIDSFNRLIAEGYLCTLIPKRTQTLLDVSGVHMRGNEFIPSELQTAVNKDDVTQAALREALEMGHDRKQWLIFASGVEHAENIAGMLTDMGEPCVPVHSKMSAKQRDDNIEAFKRGDVRSAVNNNVLTTGHDFPRLDFIVMLRPTNSSRLWVQMLGRGTRVYPGKLNCLVGDFAGNTKRLGPVNDPVIPGKKGARGGDAPIRLCEMCGTYNHASVRICIGCGYEFPIAVKLRQSASTDDLIKGDMPIVDIFQVDHISISEHNKQGRPPSIKVVYYCGLQRFNEFVCFEHERYTASKARMWWRERTHIEIPKTTVDALASIDALKMATHLRVWINKKYPEILKHCFDGTAFGTEAAGEAREPATVDIRKPGNEFPAAVPERDSADDDDIPF